MVMVRTTACAAIAAASLVLGSGAASAQQLLKFGLVVSMTGAFNTVGKAAVNGIETYLRQHGDTVAGRKIQLVIKDDSTTPDAAKRLAQQLIVNDKIAILGAGITPSALTIAPLATEAKIATVVLASGASVTVERSPYMVRTSFTLAQSSATIADWATKNGAKRVVTLVNDWAPGLEAEAAFKDRAATGGIDASAARQSGLCAVPAARPQPQPGYPVRVLPRQSGRHFRQTVPRARHGQVRHPHHRSGRSYR
jgi:branched-chain amino acid transport system substrate-binding protein